MILRSSFPDVDIPNVSLTEHVLGPAVGFGDRTAMVDALSGERLSYADLVSSVGAGAAGLRRLGVGVGDVVALISQNQPRYPVALHATVAAGAAITPMNPALTYDEIVKQLRTSKARVLITSEEVADKAYEAGTAVGVEHFFVLGTHPKLRPFTDMLTEPSALPKLDIDPATTVAALPFSSGTTGLAKGVMLTHRNLVANLNQNAVCWSLSPDDVLAGALPFFHIYGFTIILNAGLRAGATIVTLPRFSLPHYLRMVQEHRVTRAFFAPPMVLMLATAAEVDDYDLSSVRHGISGAAPLDVDVTRRAEERLGCLIRQGYGMTEASPGTHLTPDTAFASTPPGSIGPLLPNTEARLVDPATGEDVPAGGTGELLVRGPQVMAGYLDNPAATADTITDGWLHTGDLVRVDENGVYWIVDRLKELIKYKGYQVPPAELESVLLTHPDVLDAAVVGVPHPEAGEAPKAFVVAAKPLDADDLMAYVADRVAPYKKIRAVEFIDQVPKSPSGKILRRLLKARDQPDQHD